MRTDRRTDSGAVMSWSTSLNRTRRTRVRVAFTTTQSSSARCHLAMSHKMSRTTRPSSKLGPKQIDFPADRNTPYRHLAGSCLSGIDWLKRGCGVETDHDHHCPRVMHCRIRKLWNSLIPLGVNKTDLSTDRSHRERNLLEGREQGLGWAERKV